MKHIKTFEQFQNEQSGSEDKPEALTVGTEKEKEETNEDSLNEQTMFIGDFSDGFSDFYDFVSKYSKQMDSDTIKHIKEAIKHLDEAWESECDAHGVDYEQYKVKI
jgi:hypothetical protein